MEIYNPVDEIGFRQLLDKNIKLGDMYGLNEHLEQVCPLALVQVYDASQCEGCGMRAMLMVMWCVLDFTSFGLLCIKYVFAISTATFQDQPESLPSVELEPCSLGLGSFLISHPKRRRAVSVHC